MFVHTAGFPAATGSCSHFPYCQRTVTLKILAMILQILADNYFKFLLPFSVKMFILLSLRHEEIDLRWLILWLIHGVSRVIWSGEAFLAPSDCILLVVRLSLALCYLLL